MKNCLCILGLVTALSVSAQADNEKKLSKKELIEQADYHFFKENLDKALELYNIILDNYPRNHYVQYHQYVAYHLTKGRGEDLDGLKEFEENEGHTDKFYNYWLGRIHYNRYEFELAQEHFQAFLELDIYKTREIIKETLQRLDDAKLAQEFYLNTNDFEIELLPSPINSEHADLSPAFFAGHNELLFVSSRPGLTEVDLLNPGFQVFHIEKDGSGDWNTPSVLNNLGILNHNNTKIEVVDNDGRLFVYQEENGEGDLLYSQPNGDTWTSPVEFDSNLKKRNIESHFFINDDETSILFSTRSLAGDLDIYQSELDAHTLEWSDPSPVIGGVNSNFDEDSPFLSHDGQTLYFSSNSPYSVGGFDVFKCEWQPVSQSWGSPENLGFPINTIDNEINFQLNADNISGFISSNRLHGEGDYDIYYFHKKGKVMASGSVYDELTKKPIEGLQIDFHPINYKDETFRTLSDQNGFYQNEIFTDEKFVVEISKDGRILHADEIESNHQELHKSFKQDFYITIPEILDQKTDFYALYDKRTPEPTYEKLSRLGSKFRAGQKAMLRNVYFDLHSAHIKEESIGVMNALLNMMTDYSDLRIVVEGHTDNSGSADLNLVLSQNRASSVKKFLVSNGISAERISTRGYGSTRPLASNDDEQDGRELNRRIEVVVIE
jgi:outer membrane protein OmpA-like peptidoglycan-associated protein